MEPSVVHEDGDTLGLVDILQVLHEGDQVVLLEALADERSVVEDTVPWRSCPHDRNVLAALSCRVESHTSSDGSPDWVACRDLLTAENDLVQVEDFEPSGDALAHLLLDVLDVLLLLLLRGRLWSS